MSQEKQEQLKVEENSEVIRVIIAQQTQKLHLEEKKLLLEEKKLEHNTRMTEQAMKFNSSLLKEAPKNRRKLIATQAIAVGLILALILSFIGFCLYLGKEEVVNKLIVFFTHTISLIIGLLVGRKIRHKNKENNEKKNIDDAEIVE